MEDKDENFVYKVLMKTVDKSLDFVTRSNDIRSAQNQIGVVTIIRKLHDVICGVRQTEYQYKDLFRSLEVQMNLYSISEYFFKIRSIFHQMNWDKSEVKEKDIIAILVLSLPEGRFKTKTREKHENSVNRFDFFHDINEYEKSLTKYVH